MYTREELEAAGYGDFRNFLREVWDHLGLPPPTPVQLSIAKTLQHGPKRLIVQGFRGVGKSWITAAYVLWLLRMDPQLKILVVSASQPLADNFSLFCKSIVATMPLLQDLRPSQEWQRTRNDAWDVGPATSDPSPSVRSLGITSQLTGSRADIIIPDDIEIPKNSYTFLLRERLKELVKEFDAILKPLPTSRVLYLGTPQSEQSIYTALQERGYETRIWPAEIPARIEQYRGRLSPFVMRLIERGAKPGDPTDAKRFSKDDLLERRISYGSAGYALQFMLDTSPSDADAHPLKLSDLIVTDCDRELGPSRLVWGMDKKLVIDDLAPGGFDGDVYHRPAWVGEQMLPWEGTVMAIDPSGKGTDETAFAIVRYLHGLLYLVDSGGFTDGFSEHTLDSIAKRAAFHGVNYVIVEENFGGGMFGQLLKPYLAKYKTGAIDEDFNGWSRGQKEQRICDTLQPVLEQHRLVMDRKVIERDAEVQAQSSAYSLIYQLTRMKRLRGALAHEDRLETVSMAVAYWTDRMARDAEEAEESHKQALFDKELEDFAQHVFDPCGEFRQSEPLWHRRR